MRLMSSWLSHASFPCLRAYVLAWGMRRILNFRNLLLRLARLISPSELTLYDAALGQVRTQSLAALVSLHIPETLIRKGPQTASMLARQTGADTARLNRLLRFAACEGWLRQRGIYFSANRETRKLSRDDATSLAHFIQYFASKTTALAFVQMAHVVQTGADAYPVAHGMGVWDYFAVHPDEGRVFDEAMIAMTRLDADALARAYPFARHRVLYDVGGGRGQQLQAILARHPALRGCVVDLPSVIARHGQASPETQFQYLPGDFFVSLPRGADVIFLRNILHDWDDARALCILRNVRESVVLGASLLIAEMLIGPDRAFPVGVLSDMTMLCATEGGRQRSRGDFEALLTQACFQLVRIWPSGTPMVLVEARAVA